MRSATAANRRVVPAERYEPGQDAAARADADGRTASEGLRVNRVNPDATRWRRTHPFDRLTALYKRRGFIPLPP
jgi:hypothetical protein